VALNIQSILIIQLYLDTLSNIKCFSIRFLDHCAKLNLTLFTLAWNTEPIICWIPSNGNYSSTTHIVSYNILRTCWLTAPLISPPSMLEGRCTIWKTHQSSSLFNWGRICSMWKYEFLGFFFRYSITSLQLKWQYAV